MNRQQRRRNQNNFRSNDLSIHSAQLNGANSAQSSNGLDITTVAEIAVDLWRIARRIEKRQSVDIIEAASDRAQDRLRRIGFETINLTGHGYDENMRVRVLEHLGGMDKMTIVECLTPAIYFKGEHVREAEVITKGE